MDTIDYANVVLEIGNQIIAYINASYDNELIRARMKKFGVPVSYGYYLPTNMLVVSVEVTGDPVLDFKIKEALVLIKEAYR
jgi:hypothetical protein